MSTEEETTDVEEEAQEPDEAEQTPEPAGDTEAPEGRLPTDELKLVIIIKADSVMIGAQSPNCDPIYKTFKGDLAAALQQVPDFVVQANQQWDANPRYPKAKLPQEPKPTATQARPQPAATKPQAQMSWF